MSRLGGLPFASKALVEFASNVEQLNAYGRAVGLTDDATRQVVDAWIGAYQRSPFSTDWGRIRSALVNRASGARWDPQDE
jgi:hypothetical protein